MKVDLSLDSMDDSDPESGIPLWSISELATVIGVFFKEIWPESQNYESIEISVNFISEEEMKHYNRTYRKINGPTDVLSFPMWEYDTIFTPPEKMDPLPLGDILVCPSIVKNNCSALRKSYPSEMSLMIAHGILHLLGMDHDSPERKKEMWDLQGFLAGRIESCIRNENFREGGSPRG